MSSEKIDIQNTAIEVSTEQLSAKAAQIKYICSDIFTHFNNIEKAVHYLQCYYIKPMDQQNDFCRACQNIGNKAQIAVDVAFSFCQKKNIVLSLKEIADNATESR